MAAESTAVEKDQEVVSLWWMPALRGVLLIVFGFMMFTWGRGTTIVAMIEVMGAYWLIGGVIDLVQGVLNRSSKSRGWAIVGGVISMVAGFFVMGHPVISGLMAGFYLTYFMGIAAALVGLSQVLDGKQGERTLGTTVMGIFSIIFGVIVMFNPLMTQRMVVFVLPFWAILAGLGAVVSSIRMKAVEG